MKMNVLSERLALAACFVMVNKMLWWQLLLEWLLWIVCSGQTPSEADFNLLDTARKVDVYGLHLFAALVCFFITDFK